MVMVMVMVVVVMVVMLMVVMLMVVVVMMLVEGGRCNAMLIENRGQAHLASGLSPMHTDSLPRL